MEPSMSQDSCQAAVQGAPNPWPQPNMTPEVECIIKLGGSAITNKDVIRTPIPKNISAAADIIAGISGRCIVVHGAGSFGHFEASEYKVSQGYRHLSSEQRARVQEGFCKTRLSVTTLNHLIVQALVDKGISAVGASVCRAWKTKGRSKVTQNDCQNVAELLSEKFVPVLHGDCVLDEDLGCTILSGDNIIEVLSRYFRPKRVVFLSNVDGIYTAPPQEPTASLIPHIFVREDGSIATSIATDQLDHDVTGGIKNKISSACSIVRNSEGAMSVFVCRLGSEAAISACHVGDEAGWTGGTLIQLEGRPVSRQRPSPPHHTSSSKNLADCTVDRT
ncbi:uncharacterized protein [Diadema antillarum]|uniref:uncharacterized protein n=1 Tax=Diadema antillarum TaxID=105358 RepID=UPI003A857854